MLTFFLSPSIACANSSAVSSPITFANDGNAEIIGQNPVKAEARIATIILKTKNLKNKITLKATSDKLQENTIIITK